MSIDKVVLWQHKRKKCQWEGNNAPRILLYPYKWALELGCRAPQQQQQVFRLLWLVGVLVQLAINSSDFHASHQQLCQFAWNTRENARPKEGRKEGGTKLSEILFCSFEFAAIQQKF